MFFLSFEILLSHPALVFPFVQGSALGFSLCIYIDAISVRTRACLSSGTVVLDGKPGPYDPDEK